MEDRFNTALLLDALKAPKEKLPRAQAALWLAGLCTQSDVRCIPSMDCFRKRLNAKGPSPRKKRKFWLLPASRR